MCIMIMCIVILGLYHYIALLMTISSVCNSFFSDFPPGLSLLLR